MSLLMIRIPVKTPIMFNECSVIIKVVRNWVLHAAQVVLLLVKQTCGTTSTDSVTPGVHDALTCSIWSHGSSTVCLFMPVSICETSQTFWPLLVNNIQASGSHSHLRAQLKIFWFLYESILDNFIHTFFNIQNHIFCKNLLSSWLVEAHYLK